ncbi:hypothetical protein HC931_06785 [Candidatus Gracilibacteria bacterium]|nr:hypothetical protein [Candidatus Gracilibacteria bacterium]
MSNDELFLVTFRFLTDSLIYEICAQDFLELLHEGEISRDWYFEPSEKNFKG